MKAKVRKRRPVPKHKDIIQLEKALVDLEARVSQLENLSNELPAVFGPPPALSAKSGDKDA